MSFTIEEFNRLQAEKFDRHQQKEKKIQEEENNKQAEIQKQKDEEARLEQESIMLKEMQYRESFDIILDQIDNIIILIHAANDIMEDGMHTHCFKTLLEKNTEFANDVNLLPEMAERVMSMIAAISENPNTMYNIANKDMNFEASKDITDNIKECLKLVHTDESSINIQLMNTDNDEEYAKNLQIELNKFPNNRFPRIRQPRIARKPIRRLNKVTKGITVNTPTQYNQNTYYQQYPDDYFPDMPDMDDIDELELMKLMTMPEDDKLN